MNGSEKQVAWAEDIKALALTRINEHRQALIWKWQAKGADMTAPSRVETLNDIDAAAVYVEAQTEAKWFIDNLSHIGKKFNDEYFYTMDAVIESLLMKARSAARKAAQ